MKVRTFVVLAVVFLMAGMAWAGSIETLQKLTQGYQLPAAPAAGKAMIYVIRPTSDLGHENVAIYHNDGNGETYKGEIKGLDYMYFEVAPGKHCIASEKANKRGICFQVNNNETIFLKQTMAPAGEVEYLDIIDPALGKYYVSNAVFNKNHK